MNVDNTALVLKFWKLIMAYEIFSSQELIEAVFCQLNHHNRLQLTIQIHP